MTQEPVRLTGACLVMRAMLAGSVFASAELGKYSKRKAPSTPQGLCISCLVGEAKKEKRRVRRKEGNNMESDKKEKLSWIVLLLCVFYIIIFIAFGIGYQYGKKDAYMNNIKSLSKCL